MQGASAIERILDAHRGGNLRVFVVWEPVLLTDWSSPSTANMRRVRDPRVCQFWDRGRLLSKAMGERDRHSIVWDWAAVYSPDAVWDKDPPHSEFQDGPVVRIAAALRSAVSGSLAAAPQSRQ